MHVLVGEALTELTAAFRATVDHLGSGSACGGRPYREVLPMARPALEVVVGVLGRELTPQKKQQSSSKAAPKHLLSFNRCATGGSHTWSWPVSQSQLARRAL